VVVTVAGGVTLMIMADAVMVTVGNRTGTVGRIQAIQQFTPALLGLLFAARLGGYVTQHWSYATCFRAAALVALCSLPLTPLIDEARVAGGPHARETAEEHAARREAKRAERARTAEALRHAARSPGLWAVVAFVFYLIFTPGTNTAMFYYQVDALHFSKQFLGNLGQYGSAGIMAGILLFAAVSRRLPPLALSAGAWLLDCSLYLINFGLHDPLSAKLIAFAGSLLGIVYALSLFTLAARACPPGIEGTVYGLVMSAIGLAGTLGEKVGSALYDAYGPAHGHSVAHGWFALNGWGLGLTLLAGLLLPLMPAWAKDPRPAAQAVPDAQAAAS
jgi:MFS family permease